MLSSPLNCTNYSLSHHTSTAIAVSFSPIITSPDQTMLSLSNWTIFSSPFHQLELIE
eukprot:m.271372 g.271372  ORF g.271372 m.271372 type:complete len:57 (-) comp54775_c0_seq13:197-367(-)